MADVSRGDPARVARDLSTLDATMDDPNTTGPLRRQAGVPDNRAAWDALADAYQHHVGWPDDDLTWGLRCPPEGQLALITDVVRDARTLVLGCGGGQDLVALHRLGAGTLTGVDVSERQLRHARQRLDAAGIAAELVHTEATDLSAIGDGRADLIVSVQALDYVADLAALFAEVRRVLVPGGTLAFSVLHPADLATTDAAPYRWQDSYFVPQRDWVWDGLADTTPQLRSWFRTPSAWFTAVTDAGLTVERLLEPPAVDDRRWLARGWLDGSTYRKLDLVPGTILLRARR